MEHLLVEHLLVELVEFVVGEVGGVGGVGGVFTFTFNRYRLEYVSKCQIHLIPMSKNMAK